MKYLLLPNIPQYFRVTDPRVAVFKIQNLPDAIELLTQATLRNIIATMTLDDTFSSRDYINHNLLHQVCIFVNLG